VKNKLASKPSTSTLTIAIPAALAVRFAKAASKCRFQTLDGFLAMAAFTAMDSLDDAGFRRDFRAQARMRGLLGTK
jgi:hypothetical protein